MPYEEMIDALCEYDMDSEEYAHKRDAVIAQFGANGVELEVKELRHNSLEELQKEFRVDNGGQVIGPVLSDITRLKRDVKDDTGACRLEPYYFEPERDYGPVVPNKRGGGRLMNPMQGLGNNAYDHWPAINIGRAVGSCQVRNDRYNDHAEWDPYPKRSNMHARIMSYEHALGRISTGVKCVPAGYKSARVVVYYPATINHKEKYEVKVIPKLIATKVQCR